MNNDRLGLLYAEHNGWLKGWLYRRLGCTSQAADLAQDTFVRLLQAQRKAGENLSLQRPRAYLATVGRRLVYDHFRRQSLEQTYLEMLALMPEGLALSPQEQWQMHETLLALDALLDSLKPMARTVEMPEMMPVMMQVSSRGVNTEAYLAGSLCIGLASF